MVIYSQRGPRPYTKGFDTSFRYPSGRSRVFFMVQHPRSCTKISQNITATSVLIAHAENDWDIPDSHSDVLFQAFLERHLPPLDIPSNVLMMSTKDWEIVQSQQKARQTKRNEILKSTTLANFGRVDEFSENGRTVVLVKTLAGAHDYIGLQEGLQDIIGRIFAIGKGNGWPLL